MFTKDSRHANSQGQQGLFRGSASVGVEDSRCLAINRPIRKHHAVCSMPQWERNSERSLISGFAKIALPKGLWIQITNSARHLFNTVIAVTQFFAFLSSLSYDPMLSLRSPRMLLCDCQFSTEAGCQVTYRISVSKLKLISTPTEPRLGVTDSGLCLACPAETLRENTRTPGPSGRHRLDAGRIGPVCNMVGAGYQTTVNIYKR